MIALRPYQTEAVDAAVSFIRKSVEPCLIDAATGSGKSLLAACIAEAIHKATGKRVLVLAPSAELVVQNFGKYIAFGNQASMFSASTGYKSTRHHVVFGSPLTVANSIGRFCQTGQEGFALVILDEAHGITPTVRGIIDKMREANPNLRVVGMTATPYRMGSGYIFREHVDGTVNDDQAAKEPYFQKCVYRVDARDLIGQGYLTPPVIGQVGAESYDTSGLALNSRGQFDATDIDRAFHGHGRKTSLIVADVLEKARDRKGVMFFAATVQHAGEIMASLPPSMSAIVTADTPKGERASILRRFLAQELKYLVNVSVLTVGFDAPHVDVIALMRRTESVGLLQQIIGRGLRISPGKQDVLILDYTTNVETHCPDGDLFAPVIKAKMGGGESSGLDCVCPDCGYENSFTANPKTLEYKKDAAGYCLDLDGRQIETGFGPLPGHFGRRCWGQIKAGGGKFDRCSYRWTFKECPECEAENDIAARYCCACKAEIVDPNEKLAVEFKAMKRDPTNRQTDKVLSMTVRDTLSAKGNRTKRIEWVTEYRQFATWVMPDASSLGAQSEYAKFMRATDSGEEKPRTITYQKEASSAFYRIYAYNQPADEPPVPVAASIKAVKREA